MKKLLGTVLFLCMLFSILPANVFAASMASSKTEAVKAAATATAKADTTFTEKAQPLKDVIPFTVAEPVSGQKHSGTVTTSHPDIEITNVTWVGKLDANGKYIVGNTYDVVVAFKLKGNVNKTLKVNVQYRKAAVNGEEITYNVSQRSDRAGYFTKSFEVKPPKPVVDIKNVYTQAQADKAWVTVNPMYQTEIIVKDGQTLKSATSGFSIEQQNCVKKIVLDYTYSDGDAWSLQNFRNLEELWLGPNVDPAKFFGDYQASRTGLTGDEILMPYETSNLDSQKMTAFIPESSLNKLPEDGIYKRFTTKVYSGSLTEAYKEGPSAARERCTNHDYSAVIYTPDRVYTMKSCQAPIRYYYSCSICGKCEYNQGHTTLVNPNYTFNLNTYPSDHYFAERNLSDKYFLGTNSRGERVYWKTCSMCGKIHNDALMPGEAPAQPALELERATLTNDSVNAFAVKADSYVTAKMSEWAQNEVQWASQNGILDLNLMGNDYTKPITRLQFASIAVKLAECLTGTAITPAPKGTFADTDNEYVLKAYAAGITSGVSATEFNPNGTLTRQQMATFIYRALMYVKDNTNIRYTTYTPALESYNDSREIADWARTSLGFMNALGLVKGVSATEISPNGTCTIEQAVVVANRSVNADQIGWYQVPVSTEEKLLTFASELFESRYYYAPSDHAPTQTAYYNSTRIWVDTPASGGQKASENPDVADNSIKSRMLATVDPFTGQRAYVPATNFRPIKDLKSTDASDYNQYYGN